MRKWEDALKEHKQAILDKGYKEEQLLGIFLYGSQNYGCETEESDVDTKAIYIPTFEELCFDDPVSKEIQLKNDEHCEIKDIREMVKNFQKQNINFLEILFTDKCINRPIRMRSSGSVDFFAPKGSAHLQSAGTGSFFCEKNENNSKKTVQVSKNNVL